MNTVTTINNGTGVSAGGHAPAATARWGFPEFFVISQTAIPALVSLGISSRV